MDVGESFGAGQVSSGAARRIPLAAKTERQMPLETGSDQHLGGSALLYNINARVFHYDVGHCIWSHNVNHVSNLG